MIMWVDCMVLLIPASSVGAAWSWMASLTYLTIKKVG
jgi:hypothetical protein